MKIMVETAKVGPQRLIDQEEKHLTKILIYYYQPDLLFMDFADNKMQTMSYYVIYSPLNSKLKL